MFAISDAKIEIRVSALIDAVGGSCRPDGQDGGRALRPLSPANLLDARHSRRRNVSYVAAVVEVITSGYIWFLVVRDVSVFRAIYMGFPKPGSWGIT